MFADLRAAQILDFAAMELIDCKQQGSRDSLGSRRWHLQLKTGQRLTVTCVVSLVDERRRDGEGGVLGNTEREVERDTVEGKETEHIR